MKEPTSDIWYPVEYAGYYNIQTTPYYDSGINVLNVEECERAEINATLCAAAPELGWQSGIDRYFFYQI